MIGLVVHICILCLFVGFPRHWISCTKKFNNTIKNYTYLKLELYKSCIARAQIEGGQAANSSSSGDRSCHHLQHTRIHFDTWQVISNRFPFDALGLQCQSNSAHVCVFLLRYFLFLAGWRWKKNDEKILLSIFLFFIFYQLAFILSTFKIPIKDSEGIQNQLLYFDKKESWCKNTILFIMHRNKKHWRLHDWLVPFFSVLKVQTAKSTIW